MADIDKIEELEDELTDVRNQLEDLQSEYDTMEDELEQAREDYRAARQQADHLAECLNEMRDIAVIGEHVRTVLDKYQY